MSFVNRLLQKTGIFSVFVTVFFTHYSTADANYIQSLVADIEVQEDSSIRVTENIEFVFTKENNIQKHCIPTAHRDASSSPFKDRYVVIDVAHVRIDGEEISFAYEESPHETCINIPDIESESFPESRMLELKYVVYGVVSYPKYGGADINWDVTGNGWSVPIQKIEARISVLSGTIPRERSCFHLRVSDSNTFSCAVTMTEDGTVVFAATNLNTRDAFVFSQTLQRNTMKPDVREKLNTLFWSLFSGLIVSGTLLYIIFGRLRNKEVATE